MKEEINKLKEEFKMRAPGLLEDLNEGAQTEEILKLEKLLGVKLPEDFKELYFIHNGEYDYNIFPGERFLSINEIIQEWSCWKNLYDNGDLTNYESQPDEGVKNDWWNPRWIPFTTNEAGDNLSIDLDPDINGVSGQVITMWHDMESRNILANSITQYIEKITEGLKDGSLICDEEYGVEENF